MTGPVEAEATGQPFITATFREHEYKVPTDADDWPLALIAVSVGVRDDGKLFSHHPTVMDALRLLLGDQWPDFLATFPRRRDMVPASQAFAAAAGFEGTATDLAFGALPRLLAVLDFWGGAAEATLAGLGIDYRDRFRFDTDGLRRLTLRQINNRLSYARPDSALAIAQNGGRIPFTATDLLLMDLYEASTGIAHPSRPLTAEQKAERETQRNAVSKAAAEYRKRHPSRRHLAVAMARANASQLKGRTDGAD